MQTAARSRVRRLSMRAILVCTAALLSALAGPTAAQVRRVAEMSTTSLRALDRERTAVVLVGGILEEHGPYLPAFTDGYVNERLAADLATAIAARPGWTALVFPTIPLGVGGANEIGRRFSVAGTYTVRASTLRAVFMDLADELGAQGFRWVFAVHGHGAPSHNRALDDAGDYFEATYGGRMLHLTGLLPVLEAEPPMSTAAEERENGLEIHAGRRRRAPFWRSGPTSCRARSAAPRRCAATACPTWCASPSAPTGQATSARHATPPRSWAGAACACGATRWWRSRCARSTGPNCTRSRDSVTWRGAIHRTSRSTRQRRARQSGARPRSAPGWLAIGSDAPASAVTPLPSPTLEP